MLKDSAAQANQLASIISVYSAHPLDFVSLNRGFFKPTGTYRTRNYRTPGRSYGIARNSRGNRQASRAIDGMGKTTLIGGCEEL